MVAASGTSLTTEQIKLIKRYTSNIKIIFDGDPAGVKASLRGLDMVLEADMNVKLVLLPDNDDPDSFLSKVGTEKFTTFLKENEEDFVFFKTRVLLEDSGKDPIKKAGALKNIVESISKISDAIKRSLYIRQCSIMLDMDEALLVRETNKYIREAIRKKNMDGQGRTSFEGPDEGDWITEKKAARQDDYVPVTTDEVQEKAVAQILVRFGHEWFDETNKITMAKHIVEEMEEVVPILENAVCQEIFSLTKKILDNHETFGHQVFITHEDEAVRNFAVDALSYPYEYAGWEKKGMLLQTQKMPDENYLRESQNAILRLKLKKANKSIAAIEKELMSMQGENHDANEYLLQIKVLQALKKERNEMAEWLGTVIL